MVRWCIGRKLCYYWCDRSLTAELPQMTRAGPHIPHRFSETSTTFSPPSVLSVHFLLLPLLLSSAHPPCWLFFCFFILFHVDFPSPSYPRLKDSLNSNSFPHDFVWSYPFMSLFFSHNGSIDWAQVCGQNANRTKCQPDIMPTKGWHFVQTYL